MHTRSRTKSTRGPGEKKVRRGPPPPSIRLFTATPDADTIIPMFKQSRVKVFTCYRCTEMFISEIAYEEHKKSHLVATTPGISKTHAPQQGGAVRQFAAASSAPVSQRVLSESQTAALELTKVQPGPGQMVPTTQHPKILVQEVVHAAPNVIMKSTIEERNESSHDSDYDDNHYDNDDDFLSQSFMAYGLVRHSPQEEKDKSTPVVETVKNNSRESTIEKVTEEKEEARKPDPEPNEAAPVLDSDTAERPKPRGSKGRFVKRSAQEQPRQSHKPRKPQIGPEKESTKPLIEFTPLAEVKEEPVDDFGFPLTAENALVQPEIHIEEHAYTANTVLYRKRQQRCPFCGAGFWEAADLQEHVMIHIIEKPHGCNKCGQRFVLKENLLKHVKNTHGNSFEHKCPKCAEVFSGPGELRDHLRVHVPAKPYVCTYCETGFATGPELKDHMRTHTGKDPLKTYICSKCGGKCDPKMEVFMDKSKKPYEVKVIRQAGTSCCAAGTPVAVSSESRRSVEISKVQKKRKPQILVEGCSKISNEDLEKCVVPALKIVTNPKPLIICAKPVKPDVMIPHVEPYICKYCGTGFKEQYDMRKHIRIHTGRNFHQCTICYKRFNQITQLTRHIRSHTMELPHKCDLCDKAFRQRYELTEHKDEHTPLQLKCKNCQQMFTTRKACRNHACVNTGTNTPLHVCTECGKVFRMRWMLTKHMRNHVGHAKPYLCQYCSKTFRHWRLWKDHQSIHTGEKRYRCHLCEKRFTYGSSLQLHIKEHMGTATAYLCPTCGRSFNRRSYFDNHMKIHTGEKPHQCVMCQKKFRVAEFLKIHMRTHTGEKPYPCPQCDRRFSMKINMKTHLKIHARGAPLMCRECGKTFITLSRLEKHTHTHRLHPCKVCSKTFKKGSKLKRHMKTHGDVLSDESEPDYTIPKLTDIRSLSEESLVQSGDSRRYSDITDSYMQPSYSDPSLSSADTKSHQSLVGGSGIPPGQLHCQRNQPVNLSMPSARQLYQSSPQQQNQQYNMVQPTPNSNHNAPVQISTISTQAVHGLGVGAQPYSILNQPHHNLQNQQVGVGNRQVQSTQKSPTVVYPGARSAASSRELSDADGQSQPPVSQRFSQVSGQQSPRVVMPPYTNTNIQAQLRQSYQDFRNPSVANVKYVGQSHAPKKASQVSVQKVIHVKPTQDSAQKVIHVKPTQQLKNVNSQLGGPPQVSGHSPSPCKLPQPQASGHIPSPDRQVIRIQRQANKTYSSQEVEPSSECVYCGERFHRASDLMVHIKVHTGVNPHQCGKCGKAFITAAYLERHTC